MRAQTAALVSLEKKQIVFHKMINSATEKMHNLDEDSSISFASRMPGEIANFPSITLNLDKAYQNLELKIGIKPVSAEMVLLPIWSLKVQHKRKKTKRTISIDAATGRLLSGYFKKN
jgi:hypothetical protein